MKTGDKVTVKMGVIERSIYKVSPFPVVFWIDSIREHGVQIVENKRDLKKSCNYVSGIIPFDKIELI